jgi:hypothetical protein
MTNPILSQAQGNSVMNVRQRKLKELEESSIVDFYLFEGIMRIEYN